MDPLKDPVEMKAKWCALRPNILEAGTWFIARRKFVIDADFIEAIAWIASGGVYQLFINSRLVGGGPRPHSLPDRSYADQYDISRYLVKGENTVGVVFRLGALDLPRHPGFWCQIDVDDKFTAGSDDSWDILDVGRGLIVPISLEASDDLSVTFDREYFPNNWCAADLVPGSKWHKAEWLRTVDEPGGAVVFYPLRSEELAEKSVPAKPVKNGVFHAPFAASTCDFAALYSVPGVYLASAFHYEEESCCKKMIFSCDAPYVLYCNNTVVCKGNHADALALDIDLRNGWNRILIYCDIKMTTSGIFCSFPGVPATEPFLLVDTVENSPAGWNLVGPLRLPLERASAGIILEGCNISQYRKMTVMTTKNSAWIRSLEFESHITDCINTQLASGEYMLARFDRLRYGTLVVEVMTSAGSIVDIVTGNALDDFGVPVNEGGRRSVYSLRTGAVDNFLVTPTTDEFLYCMILARRTDSAVTVKNIGVYESFRTQNRIASFSCSDTELNDIWEVGLNTLRRGAAYKTPLWRDSRGARLFDQYVQAFNMLSVFNDAAYSRGFLQTLIESQLETGEFAVAVHSRELPRQVEQLFAFPLWLIHHYGVSGDWDMLQRGAAALEKLIAFFRGFVDADRKMILLPDCSSGFGDLFEEAPLPEKSLSVSMNAQYCRLLLSAGEIFKALNRERDSERCFREAVLLADRLHKEACDSGTGLFPRAILPDGSRVSPGDLQTNFMALFAGVHSLEDFQKIFFNYFNFAKPFSKVEGADDSRYFNFFFLEMLFSLNQSEWGLRYLRDYYGRRYNESAGAWQRDTSEFSDLPDESLYGGRLMVPNAFLLREGAGVRSAEPGFRAIYFNPPIGILDYAKVKMPVISGEIAIEWRKVLVDCPDDEESCEYTLFVKIDADYPLTVYPELPPDVLEMTTFDVSELITVAHAPEKEQGVW